MIRRVLPCLALALALALVLAACSPYRQEPWSPAQAGLRVIPEVPFRAAERGDDSGPAGLAALMAYSGREVPVATITAGTYIPTLGGTLMADLEDFAARQGFATRSGIGDLELLRREIDAGRPVLIAVRKGLNPAAGAQYLVVFGYRGESFLVHTGVRQGVFIAAADLWPRWYDLSRPYLVIEPPGTEKGQKN